MNELEILNIISTKIGPNPTLCRTFEIYDDPFTTHVFYIILFLIDCNGIFIWW